MKIAVLDDYQDLALSLADWSLLEADVTRFGDTISGPALVERLRPFEVICLMRERTPMPAEVLKQLPNLKLLVTTGMRNASVDIAAARSCGVKVCGTRGRAPSTAQLAMALILAGARGLFAEAHSMRDGGWQIGLGRDLDGLKLGIIGLGKQGAQLAALARPFGMELLAWSENLTEARCAEVGVRRADSLAALLGEADVASIHLVLSERSRGLIGAAELSRMKSDAVLVNTSRGPIIDETALLAALRGDRLGAAAIDVYGSEPLASDHPMRDRSLIDQGRLILTPHVGYVTRQTYEIFYRDTVAAIAAWREGAPIRELEG